MKEIEKYRQRIFGPLLDRIDIHVEVSLVDFKDLTPDFLTGESSETIRQRVSTARTIEVGRFKADKLTGNEVLEAIQFRSLDRQLFE